jgi:hypothetical protein
MGNSPGFGYTLWAVAKDLVKRHGLWRSIWLKPITIAQNWTTVFKKLAISLKRTVMLKSISTVNKQY